jgi:hypothetical protein
MSHMDDVCEAVREARNWQYAVDKQAQQMATPIAGSPIAGRLRESGVPWSTLCKLKKELADFKAWIKFDYSETE